MMSVWHYCKNAKTAGPVTFAELKAMVESGDLHDNSLVWKVGMPEWTRIRKLPELNPLLEKPPVLPASVTSRFARLRSLPQAMIDHLRGDDRH